jgi:hypothetical protein
MCLRRAPEKYIACAVLDRAAVKGHSSMWNWLFSLPGWIFCEQSFWCQRKWWACSWLYSSAVSPFLVLVNLDFPCTAHAFFPECLSNHCHGLCHIFSESCTKYDAWPLSDPSQDLIRPDTWLQIKWHKNQHVHPATWNFVHLLPRYARTSPYYNCSTNPWNYGYCRISVCVCVCVCSTNMLVPVSFFQTALLCMLKDSSLHTHLNENLKYLDWFQVMLARNPGEGFCGLCFAASVGRQIQKAQNYPHVVWVEVHLHLARVPLGSCYPQCDTRTCIKSAWWLIWMRP